MKEFGKFRDVRDGYEYRTVRIGNQTWFAENLRFDCAGSAVLENDEKNLKRYGRLYTWRTAMNATPDGWRLPSLDDWTALFEAAGGSEKAGETLKAERMWNESRTERKGTDKLGFGALPGGYHALEHGFSGKVGDYGNWWTASTSNTPSNSRLRVIISYCYSNSRTVIDSHLSMYSVRYVRN